MESQQAECAQTVVERQLVVSSDSIRCGDAMPVADADELRGENQRRGEDCDPASGRFGASRFAASRHISRNYSDLKRTSPAGATAALLRPQPIEYGDKFSSQAALGGL
jgi:hypothetical protein